MVGLTAYSLLFSVNTLAVMITQLSSTKAADQKFVLSSNNSSVALEDQCSQTLCSESNYNCFGLDCSQNGPLLRYGYCATFSEDRYKSIIAEFTSIF